MNAFNRNGTHGDSACIRTDVMQATATTVAAESRTSVGAANASMLTLQTTDWSSCHSYPSLLRIAILTGTPRSDTRFNERRP